MRRGSPRMLAGKVTLTQPFLDTYPPYVTQFARNIFLGTNNSTIIKWASQFNHFMLISGIFIVIVHVEP